MHLCLGSKIKLLVTSCKKVQVGNVQEKARSERNLHSKNRGGGKLNRQLGTYTLKTYHKPSKQLFPNRQPLSYPNFNKKNMKVQTANKSTPKHNKTNRTTTEVSPWSDQ